MDQALKSLDNLNAYYSAQLAAVADGLGIASETEKYDIFVKWKNALIKYNQMCMETIANSTQIDESASELMNRVSEHIEEEKRKTEVAEQLGNERAK